MNNKDRNFVQNVLGCSQIGQYKTEWVDLFSIYRRKYYLVKEL